MSITLDTQAYLDMVCELLGEGHTNVPVTVSGTSMTPFLDPGDTVFLNLPQSPLRPGDIVLFTRPNGRYVLHRVTAVLADGTLEILGDAQINPEYVSDPERIHAAVTAAVHGKKRLTPDCLRWRFFRGPWLRIRRIRPYVNHIRNRLRRHTGWTL